MNEPLMKKEERALAQIAELKKDPKKNKHAIQKALRTFSRSYYKDHDLFPAQRNFDA